MTPMLQASATLDESECRATIHTLKDAIRQQDGKRLILACVVLNSTDAEYLLNVIQNFAETVDQPVATSLPADPSSIVANDPQNLWLEHREAATYLGVATSTLYRYAAHQEIESRKLGGRLQYRRSTLDHFKDRTIRSARHSAIPRSIINPALSSGK